MGGKVIVLVGVSGIGKSTYAEKLKAEAESAGKRVVIVSADTYPGLYPSPGVIDPTKLPAAHAACMRQFVGLIVSMKPIDLVIVDNTNTTLVEVAPYMGVAKAYESDFGWWSVELHVCVGKPRQNIHGAPENTVKRQQHNLASSSLDYPAWWTVVEVKTGD